MQPSSKAVSKKMSMSFEDFRKRYIVASERFKAPLPPEDTLTADYNAYVYGQTLIQTKKKRSKLIFFRDSEGHLTWEVKAA